ncbi:hypothetical protein K2173_015428 [Erythroxylum novogranatense]|uniref:Uncharacterized protein n=1 Tax=Erythroxylum novogranatense TaxID=1862640 RepID=A0AAV8SRM8_9ROSI|nr:hypothetical protein K2173_015428 [Erythroxylum novogranatense]
MEQSKRGYLPVTHGITLSKFMCPKTQDERMRMNMIPYASAVGSIMYAMLCTRPDVSYALSITSRYQSDPGYIFTLNGGAVSWKSSKQETTVDSTTEAEYIVASDAAKEAVWIKKFITKLGVVPSCDGPIQLYCDNNGAIVQAKEPMSHQRSKHVLHRYHLIREIIGRGDVQIERISTEQNIVDPLTKPLSQKNFDSHVLAYGIRYQGDWF